MTMKLTTDTSVVTHDKDYKLWRICWEKLLSKKSAATNTPLKEFYLIFRAATLYYLQCLLFNQRVAYMQRNKEVCLIHRKIKVVNRKCPWVS